MRDLCLFRRGPEDMPYAPALLVALLLGCVLVMVGLGLHDGKPPAVIAGAIAGGLVQLGLVFLMLRGRGLRARFVQAATALAVVTLLFDLVAGTLSLLLPVKAWREQFLANPSQIPQPAGSQATLALLVVLLSLWQLCVWVSILRRSLEIPLAGSILVVMGLFFAYAVVVVLAASLAGVA